MNTILDPHKTDLISFKRTVEERKEDIRDITSLKKEIESLQKLCSVEFHGISQSFEY